MTLRASIFHIELALEGKAEFVRLTDPWGGGGGGEAASKPAAQPEPEDVATRLAAYFRNHERYGGAAP